ncbi:predicted protein [Naegleria gruberi]|uniref:Predicted protein n=1 Tax=Naegleria gruberi TaxID=5762 RepID=D2V6B5_NAEGR|nr:uncharacterized protein NAEGRDRAFT_47019 [Naegleria gruberi]EFC47542.1 predicted protein [Naegleria gruberi]|eukprot:XP_002680286.1 predicted protein [Naegleria gruberi strain NEG-M]
MAFKRRDKKQKKKHHLTHKKQRKTWSDRLVTNLIRNQFKSRIWKRVREFIDGFLPDSIPFIHSPAQQGSNSASPSSPSSSTSSSNGSSNQVVVINVQEQQDNKLDNAENNKIFGGKSKLLINGMTLWYDLVSFILSRERLTLDLEGFYSGGVKDYLAKVYRENGLLACISNRQVMGPIAKFLLSTLYTVSIQMPIMDTLCENYEASPMVSQLIRRIDDILLMAMNYPIDTSCLMKFKRGEAKVESATSNSLVQSLKFIKEQNGVVNGWFRGFGWSILENILYETSDSLLRSGMSLLFSKLFGLDSCGSSTVGQIALSGEQLALFNKFQSTSIDLIQDALLSPLRFSILRYRTDLVNQYTSPIDCFKQVHAKEGFRTFYKGTFIGTFLVNHNKNQ